jgi:hypothetical protein
MKIPKTTLLMAAGSQRVFCISNSGSVVSMVAVENAEWNVVEFVLSVYMFRAWFATLACSGR